MHQIWVFDSFWFFSWEKLILWLELKNAFCQCSLFRVFGRDRILVFSPLDFLVDWSDFEFSTWCFTEHLFVAVKIKLVLCWSVFATVNLVLSETPLRFRKMNFSSCLGCIRRYLFRYVTRYINESSTSGWVLTATFGTSCGVGAVYCSQFAIWSPNTPFLLVWLATNFGLGCRLGGRLDFLLSKHVLAC